MTQFLMYRTNVDNQPEGVNLRRTKDIIDYVVFQVDINLLI